MASRQEITSKERAWRETGNTDLTRKQVEMCGVKLQRLVKVGQADPKVAELMDGRWPLLEPLLLVHTARLDSRLSFRALISAFEVFS